MVRFRNTWLVAVVAIGLGGAACKKNDDAKPGDKTATGDKATGDKAGGGGVNDANGGDLSLLPVDSEMVIGLNIAQLQQSALWKQFSPKIMDKIAGNLADFKADCGFDPLDSKPLLHEVGA